MRPAMTVDGLPGRRREVAQIARRLTDPTGVGREAQDAAAGVGPAFAAGPDRTEQAPEPGTRRAIGVPAGRDVVDELTIPDRCDGSDLAGTPPEPEDPAVGHARWQRRRRATASVRPETDERHPVGRQDPVDLGDEPVAPISDRPIDVAGVHQPDAPIRDRPAIGGTSAGDDDELGPDRAQDLERGRARLTHSHDPAGTTVGQGIRPRGAARAILEVLPGRELGQGRDLEPGGGHDGEPAGDVADQRAASAVQMWPATARSIAPCGPLASMVLTRGSSRGS